MLSHPRAVSALKNITPTNVENMVSNHELTSTEQTRATEIIKNVLKVTKENILQDELPLAKANGFEGQS